MPLFGDHQCVISVDNETGKYKVALPVGIQAGKKIFSLPLSYTGEDRISPTNIAEIINELLTHVQFHQIIAHF